MFNNEMIVLAREFRGKTQKELVAELEGISQGHLSKLELGIHDANEEIIKQLSKNLDLPVSFFMQQKQHYSLPLYISGNFRKKRTLSKKKLLEIKSLINIITYNIEDLFSESKFEKSKLLDFNEEYKNNNKNLEEIKQLETREINAIDSIISKLKKHLQIDQNRPIKNLVDTLEKNGVLIIDTDFKTNQMDGFSYWIGEIPVIFVSKHTPGDRQRFTIAHELGHLVLHKKENNHQKEAEADYFASQFLMPKDVIRDYLDYINLEKLALLKKQWKVSMASLLVRAKTLDAISEKVYKGLWMQMSRLGYRKVEPILIETEQTCTMKNIISNMKNKEIEKIFNLNSSEVKTIYGI